MSSHGDGVPEINVAEFFGNERFELEERLGEGAYGVVYQAFDRAREMRVALKVLRRLGPDELFYFKREFRALADIQHLNLVRYYELFEEQGRWFLTMELVRGQSLIEFVRNGRSSLETGRARADEARLRDALAQLASALAALHSAGKVHRDVKPSNVRVTSAGRVVLLDFGLVLDADARESTRMPRVGTASFMAPEQVQGGEVGPAADYYALGAVLYECLTGRHPFVGEPFEVLMEKQTRDPLRPSEVTPFVPLDLDELCMALLSRNVSERTSGIEALRELADESSVGRRENTSRLSARNPASFVGRTRELNALLRLSNEHEDRARLALVHGESGSGKSALLFEFARRLRAEKPDAVLLSGRCFERETVPYKAFDGVVDALARVLRHMPSEDVERLLPENALLLAQVFPVLARVSELRRSGTNHKRAKDEAQVARRRAFQALRALLARIAEHAPVIIAIDDVHFADADSIALMEELLTPADLPVLFVLTDRRRPRREGVGPPEGAIETLFSRTPDALRLRLGPLSEVDARNLAEYLLSEHGGTPELAPLIAREAAGQPLFVAMLVRYVCTQKTGAIPSLDEALRENVAALPDDVRVLLSLLAVSGAPLSREVLIRASELSPARFAEAAEEVLSTRWVKTRAEERGGELELAHERVREVLVARLGADDERRYHERLAEAHARLGQPEAAALNWADAGEHERVIECARDAGVHALESLAFGRAIRSFELALAHLGPDGDTRWEVQELLAEALSLDGQAARAGDVYAELAPHRTGDEALSLRYRAAKEWLSAGAFERGLEELEKVLAALGVRATDSQLRVSLSLGLRRMLTWLKGYRWERRAEKELEKAGLLRVDALWTLVTALSSGAELRAAELQMRHLEAALELGEPLRLSRAFAMEAWLVRSGVEGRDLLKSTEFAHARELAHLSGHPHAQALAALVEAAGLYVLGQHRESLRAAEGADRRFADECRNVGWERSNARHLILACHLDSGDFRALTSRLRGFTSELESNKNPAALSALTTRFSYLERLFVDEPEAARRLLDQARELSSASLSSLNMLCAHTEIDLYLGDPNAYLRVERALRESSGSGLMRLRSARTRILFLRARAALGAGYLMPHRRHDFVLIAQRDASRLLKEGAKPAQALVELVRACSAELAGERERAIAAFGDAVLACDAASMAHYGAMARRRQGILLGGEEGRAMVVRAERFIKDQGVVDPGRLSALFCGY